MYEYFVCNETNIARLEVLVERRLNDGYTLAGNLVINTKSSEINTWYYQPMIKYTETFPTSTPEPEDVEADTL